MAEFFYEGSHYVFEDTAFIENKERTANKDNHKYNGKPRSCLSTSKAEDGERMIFHMGILYSGSWV